MKYSYLILSNKNEKKLRVSYSESAKIKTNLDINVITRSNGSDRIS